MTEDEFRRGTCPRPLEARLLNTAADVERRAAEAEAELPAMDAAHVERVRLASQRLAAGAAMLARIVARHLPPPEPSPADMLGHPDHREPGEEP